MTNTREPYVPPAIEQSVSFGPAPDAPAPLQLEQRHLEHFAHLYTIESPRTTLVTGELAQQPMRVSCNLCREHFRILHSPLTQTGRLQLAEHFMEHAR